MLRLDDVHASMSGNKIFKLLPNIKAAQAAQCRGLLTFGGAYSNHIHATAAAGFEMGIPTVGIIRADADAHANPTLSDAARWGMALHFVDRDTYRRRYDPQYLHNLAGQFPEYWLIPEGGSNDLALEGCRQLGAYIAQLNVNQVVVACGTGTTAMGIAQGVNPQQSVHAIAVLGGLTREQQRLTQAGVTFWDTFYGAGYAKISAPLAEFIYRFEALNALSLDPVYTAKTALAVSHLVASGVIAGDETLIVHTGGLQGRRSMQGQLDAYWRNNPACT
jgi:1-aminocyclopropane-1-carboxylate deaminase